MKKLKDIFIPLFFVMHCASYHASAQSDFWVQTSGFTNKRISSLLCDSVGNIYAGTGGDGIFRSTNMGATWTRLVSPQPDTFITAIAINPKGYIFYGTGQYPFGYQSYGAGGIFRSTDAGDHWQYIGLPNWLTRNIAIDHNDRIYAALLFSARGVIDGSLQVSNDDGLTWPASSFNGSGVLYVGVDSVGNVFANTSSGFFGRSTDGGASFQSLNTLATVISMSFSPDGKIYFTSNQGVYRSLDNGITWTIILSAQGEFYLTQIIVNRIHRVYVASSASGINYSPNGGNTWARNNTGLTDTNVYSMAMDTSGILYCGTGSGKVFRSNTSTTSVREGNDQIPLKTILDQNYPNPFNPTTNISFTLASHSFVRLRIFDLVGREITTLVSEELPSGRHVRQWNGTGAASGLYFYRLQAGTFTETKRILLLK